MLVYVYPAFAIPVDTIASAIYDVAANTRELQETSREAMLQRVGCSEFAASKRKREGSGGTEWQQHDFADEVIVLTKSSC
jgi:hypothetical protein